MSNIDDVIESLRLERASIRLVDTNLVIEGPQKIGISPGLAALIKSAKQRIIENIRNNGELIYANNFVRVPVNLIPAGCEWITPALLPLVDLSQDQINAIADTVSGGHSNIQDIYPLAPLQDGILFHHLMAQEGDPYLLWRQLSFPDRAVLDRYVAALNAVIARHDILRTAIVWEGLTEPVQVVWRHAPVAVEEVPLDPRDGDIATQLKERFHPRHYRIDVRRAPMLQLFIAQDPSENSWMVMYLFHHLAGDHTTLEVMQAEVRSHLMEQAANLASALPFRNFVAQARLGVSREEHETFFQKMLGDVDEPTVPFGMADVQGDGSGISEARLMIDPALAKRLRARARVLGVSAASLCHVAWGLVVSRTSGQQDPVFGTVLFGRMQGGEGSDQALGLFINTLPVRIRLGELGVKQSILEAHNLLSELLRHEHASLALAQRCSGIPAPAPLFSALLNYRHSTHPTNEGKAQPKALEEIRYLGSEERTNYPVVLSVNDRGEALGLTAQAPTSLGPARLCAMMQRALEQLVEALELDPQRPVGRLDVLAPSERQQLLVEWNATEADYPHDKCIHDLFAEQVERAPEATAVVYEDQSLSYGELNARANRLAHHLRSLGVKPDAPVAICVERSLEMIVGLLAILKAGGCYLPLDPEYPPERLSFMLKDAAPKIILTHAAVRRQLEETLVRSNFSGTVLDLDRDADDWAHCSASNPSSEAIGLKPHHLAYIIYTSGSTGEPKGVMVEHKGVVKLVMDVDYVDLGAGSRLMQMAPMVFDAATFEIWGALLNGGVTVVIDRDTSLRPHLLGDILLRYRITTLFITTALFNRIAFTAPQAFASLHHLLFGGEMVDPLAVREILEHQPPLRLTHVYGPTETVTFSTAYDVSATDARASTIPIGCPISNTRIYLLDGMGNPVPWGASGEIYIGGAGVARGYLNRPDLTSERFIESPFVLGDRLYKTGDLGLFLPDGNIEFAGRNDFQVKIRGFRIELGEIEARLLSHSSVREAVVLAREDEVGDKRLVAYYTVTGEIEIDVQSLRTHLSSELPGYMVPAAYVQLGSLPLTPNGKLDRKALPAPEGDAYGRQAYELPIGAVESTIAQIWSEVLGVEQVGRYDNFFELGGHSLLAIQILERMRRAGLQADVKDLFTTPVLAKLAERARQGAELVKVPANLIPAGCEWITPDLLPLVDLTQDQVDGIISVVHGGSANVQDIYPLAPLQEGILFHHLLEKEGDPYLLWNQTTFRDRVVLDRYISALNAVIARHDILRTAVVWEGLAEPVQVVWRRAPVVVEEISLDPNDGEVTAQMRERFDPRHYRLDLRCAPLMRVFIARDCSEDRWVMMRLSHHLCMDHSTLEVMQYEISAHLLGRGTDLAVPLPFRNFVAQARLGVSREEHETFFQKMLGDVDEPTAPFGLMDAQGDGSGIGEAHVMLAADLARRIRSKARSLGVSAASLCHVAWALVVSRCSGQQDPVFGTVLFGRMQGSEGSDRALGLFINTLPVRVSLGPVGAQESVIKAHQLLAELMHHEHASLALAQRCSGVKAPTPLFTSLLNYRHIAPQARSKAERPRAFDGVRSLGGEERTNYPLTLSVEDLGEALGLTAQAPTSLGPARLCAMMQRALEQLVEALELDPQRPVGRLDVLAPSERQQLLVEWNATEADYPHDKCIHDLFAEQVERAPEATAVVYEDQSLSYGELNARANRLAHHLRSLGVKPDAPVAICVERSLEMIVGLLAILKAGGCYLPLDPEYPPERLSFMLKDAAPKIILTHAAVRRQLEETLVRSNFSGTVLDLDRDADDWAHCSASNPSSEAIGLKPHHLAYIIYTSGSTGEPKGVMVEHKGVVNLSKWHYATFVLTPNDLCSSLAGGAFDAAAWEIWPPLLSGARILACSANASRDLVRWWKAQKLSISFLPTPVAESVFREGILNTQLRVLLVGGDVLRSIPKHALNNSLKLINNYGPTECSVVATSGILKASNCIAHIGRPISNTRIYLLDGMGNPVPQGVSGEIYIGGAGVARGYLNRPELTAERFIASPFVAGDRLYKTGDLGRYLADGNIEFLGRNDFQVKIRGFRIELGEIEARLLSHPSVREAVVIAREDEPGNKRLVAYYTAKEETGAEELRRYLSISLPDYMVPAAYVRLDVLPLTLNGKLDRKALPAPEDDAYGRKAYEAPVGPVETAVAQIWSEVLGVERVGRRDNFFELGGHSLLAIRVLERMRRAGLQADVKALFTAPVLAELAQAVGRASDAVEVPVNLIPAGCEWITPALLPLVDLSQDQINAIADTVSGGHSNIQDIYPLAPLQDGILFHHLMAQEGDPYLLWRQLSFPDRAVLDQYVAALNAVIARHDILRTAIVWEGLTEPVQVVWRHAPVAVEEVPLDPRDGDIATQLKERFHPRHYRIDVRRAPLQRLFIAHDPEKERWVMMQLRHHLVYDAASTEILNDEIAAYFSARSAALPVALPFRNFVAQARLGVSREEHEIFFQKMLGDVDEPTAPFGLMDVQGDGSGISQAHVMLEGHFARRIRSKARSLGVSVASLCHVAWALVVSRCSGQQDPVFGTILFGRMQGGEGADRALGLFINTLPVKISLGPLGVQESVIKAHQLLAELMHHEHASLALAQRCSGVKAPAPLFTSLLNYRHSTPQAKGAAERPRPLEGIRSLGGEVRNNYPITLSVEDLGEELGLTTLAVASVGAERVCAMMQRALEQLVEALELDPQRPVGRLDVLAPSERQQLLVEWNATEADYPHDKCIHDLFAEQVERAPEATAVVYEDQSLSYGELNARANRLAHHLRSLGVKPDAPVAICVERSLEMIVGLLAILKAGGCYLPLDPEYPPERLSFMLKDAAPKIILTHAAVRATLQAVLDDCSITTPVFDLDRDADDWAHFSASNPSSEGIGLKPHHLAYIIYTSGSTGEPKGVMVAHRSLANYLSCIVGLIGRNKVDSSLVHSDANFDLTITSLFPPILCGGSIKLLAPIENDQVTPLLNALEHESHSNCFSKLTPSHLSALQAALGKRLPVYKCSMAFVGGEQLTGATLRPWKENSLDCQFINHYGPTETTVGACCFPINDKWQPTETVPIGRPISNTRIYLLDGMGNPVPQGVSGEIYIGGAGVARGYLNRPELTAERFIASPFVAGDRLYKTGDLGRYLADGNIEFLGRNDFQVKIRGFRIELGEIEARLLSHPSVREAVVIAREDEPGNKRLVAYYTAKEETGAEELRRYLSISLPDYMVPAAYVRLDVLPLTLNGKLDRKALPAPEDDAYGRKAYEAPVGPVETAVAQIWSEVLGVERVGRRDNFFELGGHSLLAIRVLERMRRAGLQADVKALFTAPVLAELAQAVGRASDAVEVPVNLIPAGCEWITPALLPLVDLSQDQINAIADTVSGGHSNIQDIYPLAPLQDGILFHHLMAQEGDPYLLWRQLSFPDRAVLDQYVAALNAVIARHDILRTAIVWEGLTEPVQVVWRHAPVAVEEVPLDPRDGDIATQLKERFYPRHYRIDVRRAPLQRLFIAHDPEKERWVMMQLRHHLSGDHVTTETMQGEIAAYFSGRSAALPVALPFRNFVAQARLGVSREEHEIFFQKMLGDVDEPTAPFGLMDVQGDGSGISQAHVMLEGHFARRIRSKARSLGVSVASLCHVAWALVVSRCSGQQDPVFGTILFGRMQGGEGADRALGLFINTLPVKISLGPLGVQESVIKAHQLLAELMHHEHASLALAQRCSGVKAPAPLFTSLLNYRHSTPQAKGAAERPRPLEGIRSLGGEVRNNYPITLSVEDLGEELGLTTLAVASVGAERVCAMMQRALEQLVEALELDPQRPVGRLDVLAPSERQQLLVEWNATEADYPHDKCIHDLFAEQVERAPEATAVVYEDQSLSYGELNARANRLAHHLRSLGVKPDAPVAICVERSLEMIVGLLAILKAGGCYLPLDPEYPPERLSFMLKDAAPKIILTHAAVRATLQAVLDDCSITTPVFDLDRDADDWAHFSASNPSSEGIGLKPHHLAYIIYTSGSTGEPKGVMVAHRSLANYLSCIVGLIGRNKVDSSLVHSDANFDLTITSLFPPILCGGSIKLLAPIENDQVTPLLNALEHESHSNCFSKLTPSHLSALQAALGKRLPVYKCSMAFVGGEQLTGATLRPWKENSLDCQFINHYGPTETTVGACCFPINDKWQPTETVPIGRPISNTRIYLLDGVGNPVPQGVSGEIYIGGAGVARGYLNRPELTAERFIASPFVAGDRLYKTGDLGRYLADGNIEFLGRNDFQVKIRGFRIELGEIEARLLSHPSVREAVVIAREDEPGNKRLVAYYTAKEETGAEELRRYLSVSLPDYMVPAAYVRLDVLPLTLNGKLDRKALPAPEDDAYGRKAYEAPVGPVETAVAQIWSEVLGVERVGRRDNFFELGGHSLLAIRVLERMRRAGLQADVKALFTAPVLAELCEEMEETYKVVL